MTSRTALPVGILATGAYLPTRCVPNEEIARRVGVTEEWILRKTAIRERRYAATEEATSDLATKAGQQALARAGLTATDIDLIIVSTSTPDSPQPPTACLVQHQLGAWRAAAFDLNAVCSGFLYALDTARNLVTTRPEAHVLVIAADVYSRCLDFSDRRTAVLLGDGAGAAVVGAVNDGYGILHIDLASRGDLHHLIRIDAGGSRRPASHDTVEDGGHFFKMEGRMVREFVLDHVPSALTRLVKDTGLSPTDVAHVVPHQPNGRLLDELADHMGFPHAQVHRTVERYGNVGSASVPVTLDAACQADALRNGDVVVLTTFGGGMSMGHCLLRWDSREHRCPQETR